MCSAGDDLSAATLHTYLQDPTFVEYFNSFLLLPAFSSRVFYNADTGLFEQVHAEGMLGWGVTPSSSQATLYLADEAIGPSLDQQQSKLWVIQHRLPLFLRSDLYSEYKLCKLLTTPKSRAEVFPVTTSTKHPHTHAPPPPKGHYSLQEEQAVILPSLPFSPPSQGNYIPRRNSLSALSNSDSAQACTINHQTGRQHSSASNTPIAVSKSDIELGNRTKSVPLSDGQKSSLKRSLSVELSSKVLTFLEAPSPAEGERPPLHLVSKVLGTKSGMSAFWKFLRGKAGERNWLFWLDAERVKYYQKPIDQQRVLRELRERYLHAGAPLELPAEARSKLHVSKSSRLTLQQLGELQQALVQGLRDYWCPRFILHRRHNAPLHTSQPHPSTSSTTAIPFFRSFSTTPVALHTITPSHPHSTTSPKHPKLPSPFTPTQTPTFRKLTSVRPRSKSSPTNYQNKIQEEHPSDRNDGNHQPTKLQTVSFGDNRTSNLPSIAMPFHCEATSNASQRPHTVDTASIQPPVRGKSRKVWHKQSLHKEGQNQSPLAHFSQLAKYTQHHLPDVNSRCASVLGSKSASSMCGSRCQIFSVSGTPLHTDPPTPTPQGDTYTPLLYCLATEQRKAGGYFQQHLESLEDETFLHCLLFWRDVQEYKALFTANSFIPCAVERKAKTLYSCYIMEDSSEDICCSPSMVDTITSHLWPAYEDLFDRAEEHALQLLLEKWQELCSSEDSTFQKVSRYSSPHTNRRGHTSDNVGLEDLDEELYRYEEDETMDIFDPSFTSPSPSPTKHPSRPHSRMSMLRPLTGTPHTLTRSPSPFWGSVSQVSEQSRAISLNDIMDNPTELEHFKIYLNENYAAQDLICWMEIESFRGIPASDKHVRDLKARQLRSKYFNKKYLFGPNSPASKEAQRQVVAAGGGGYGGRLPARPRTPVFREAQKHVRARLEKKWLAGFMSTPEFIERNGGSTLSVEKRGGSQSPTPSKSFMYEKSFANSHEAILLRRVLQDEGSREPFQRYLCIKASPGTHPREDIQFWLEVQRYKEMCHAHTTEEMLQQKVSAIVDCYFQSSVPPPLQLDIQPSIADQVVKKQPGPYIFREAQAAVFKHLYYHWQDYQNFTSGYNEEEIDSAISKFETQMRQLQAATRDANFQSKQEEERKKLSMPRFETAAEREERVKKEMELTKFGEVAIAFRLSTPDTSNYTYYTEVPGERHEEDTLRQQQGVDAKKIDKSDDHFANNRSQCAVDFQSFDTFSCQTRRPTTKKSFPWDNIKPGSCVGRSMKSGYINQRSTERKEAKNVGTASHVQPTEVTAMRLAGGRGGRRQRYSPPSAALQSDKLSDPSAAESTQEHRSHFHSSRPMSSRTGASKNNSTFRGKNRKKCPIVSNSKFLPHCTISMQISGTRGSPFSYGAGLPDDQQSHLSILSIT